MAVDEEMETHLDEIYRKWYEGIDRDGGKNGWGAICGGITILEDLLTDYTLELRHHQTTKGTQLKNAGASLGNRVLSRFGVTSRRRLGEFGRTSRGAPPAASRLIELLRPLQLEDYSQTRRNEILQSLQERLVRELQPLLERDVEVIEFDPSDTFEKMLKDVLENVSKASSGAVAQHLVGSKLQLRFPDILIPIDTAAAADAPTNRPGDILVKDTVFHVTMAPQPAVYDKCKENLGQGLRVYLLVPHKRLKSAQKSAEDKGIGGQIFVQTIESFIAQNIDEIARFSKDEFNRQREELVRIYNQRLQIANERHASFLKIQEEGVLEIEESSADE